MNDARSHPTGPIPRRYRVAHRARIAHQSEPSTSRRRAPLGTECIAGYSTGGLAAASAAFRRPRPTAANLRPPARSSRGCAEGLAQIGRARTVITGPPDATPNVNSSGSVHVLLLDRRCAYTRGRPRTRPAQRRPADGSERGLPARLASTRAGKPLSDALEVRCELCQGTVNARCKLSELY
jgi:hypothetical protein